MSMTHIIDILTAIVLGCSIVGGGIRVVGKLTLIADSVNRLSESVEKVVEKTGDHEARITVLEHAPKPASRARTRA